MALTMPATVAVPARLVPAAMALAMPTARLVPAAAMAVPPTAAMAASAMAASAAVIVLGRGRPGEGDGQHRRDSDQQLRLLGALPHHGLDLDPNEPTYTRRIKPC
jgi:hypothetical protein